MKVSNMVSNRGTKVANQFIIESPNKTVFQSYKSTIVSIEYIDGEFKTFLDTQYWNYSRTTSKYRNIFLNETTKETQKKIDSGEYLLINLN